MSSNDAGSVAEGFSQVLQHACPRKPKRVQSDKSTTFFNSTFVALILRHLIHHFAYESDMKAAGVKRFHRIIKSRIYTFLSDLGSVRWEDILHDQVHAYNASTHRTIGMPPDHMASKHEDRFLTKMYCDGDTHLKPAKSQGAMVRINKR